MPNKPSQEEILEAVDVEVFDNFEIPRECRHFNCHLQDDLYLNECDVLDIFRNLEDKWEQERDSSPIGVICTINYLGEVYDYWQTRFEKDNPDSWSIPQQEELVKKIETERKEGKQPAVKYDPSMAYRDPTPPPKEEEPPKPPPPATALLFSGQGVQYKGMCEMCGLTVYEARNLFCQADPILDYNLYEMCRIDEKDQLKETEFSQIAIMVSSLAAAEELKLETPELLDGVVACAGLSLGQYSALVYAGAMSFEDAVKVIKVRGREMQKAAVDGPRQGMAAVIANRTTVDELVAEVNGNDPRIHVANYLAPENQVVAGSIDALLEFEALCKSKRVLTTRLQVNGAFHTTYMEQACEKLNQVLDETTITLPEKIKVIDNVTGKALTSADEIKQLLKDQITNSVHWEESIHTMLDDCQVKRFVELGPGQEIKQRDPNGEEKVVGRKTVLTGKRIMSAILDARKQAGKEHQVDTFSWMV